MKPLENRRILLVEDDEVNSMRLKQIFEENGAIVILAQDGQKAIEMIDKHIVDIIVSDLNMPYVDGFEMTKRIRQHNQEMPILVYTASRYSPPGIEDLAKEIGINKFLIGGDVKTALHEVITRLDSAFSENENVANKILKLKA